MSGRARADHLRALPLPRVLAALEATPDPHDPAKWRTDRGVLSLAGAKFFNWNLGVGGGGAIDLVMHVRQVGFGQALEWLAAGFGLTAPTEPSTMSAPHALTLPPAAAHHWPRVQRYLIAQRGLPCSLLPPLRESGILYADARRAPELTVTRGGDSLRQNRCYPMASVFGLVSVLFSW